MYTRLMGFKKRPEAPAGRNPDVDAWLSSTGHPRADEMRSLRDIILGADARIGECIKWKTPTFTCAGNLASTKKKLRIESGIN